MVIGASLINLSAMQASKQANTEQTIICLAMLGHNGDRRQDLVFIQGIHMSLRNSYLSRKTRGIKLHTNLNGCSRVFTLHRKRHLPKASGLFFGEVDGNQVELSVDMPEGLSLGGG